MRAGIGVLKQGHKRIVAWSDEPVLLVRLFRRLPYEPKVEGPAKKGSYQWSSAEYETWAEREQAHRVWRSIHCAAIDRVEERKAMGDTVMSTPPASTARLEPGTVADELYRILEEYEKRS